MRQSANRLTAGVLTSLLIHASAPLTYLALHGRARATPQPHVEVVLVPVSPDLIPDLAVPSPGTADAPPRAERPARRRHRTTAPPPPDEQLVVVAPAAKREPQEAARRQAAQRPGVALRVQLERARASSIGKRLIDLLINMADGRDLLGGTGLEALDAFDALLVATPYPHDARATVIVARHHLGPAELRAAFDRAAAATNRVLSWREDARFPFGQRRASTPRPGGGPDNRLFVLPEPVVLVVTTAAYLPALFSTPRADEAGTPADDPLRTLPSQVRSEGDEAGAAGTFVSLTVVGERSDGILGLAGSRAFTVSAEAAPEPFVTVTVEMTSDADALRVEGVWPALRDRLAAMPLLRAADLSPAGNRARLTREGRRVRLDVAVTEAELLRLLQAVATVFDPSAGP